MAETESLKREADGSLAPFVSDETGKPLASVSSIVMPKARELLQETAQSPEPSSYQENIAALQETLQLPAPQELTSDADIAAQPIQADPIALGGGFDTQYTKIGAETRLIPVATPIVGRAKITTPLEPEEALQETFAERANDMGIAENFGPIGVPNSVPTDETATVPLLSNQPVSREQSLIVVEQPEIAMARTVEATPSTTATVAILTNAKKEELASDENDEEYDRLVKHFNLSADVKWTMPFLRRLEQREHEVAMNKLHHFSSLIRSEPTDETIAAARATEDLLWQAIEEYPITFVVDGEDVTPQNRFQLKNILERHSQKGIEHLTVRSLSALESVSTDLLKEFEKLFGWEGKDELSFTTTAGIEQNYLLVRDEGKLIRVEHKNALPLTDRSPIEAHPHTPVHHSLGQMIEDQRELLQERWEESRLRRTGFGKVLANDMARSSWR